MGQFSYTYIAYVLTVSLGLLGACGNPTEFRGASVETRLSEPKSFAEEDQTALFATYRYDLILAGGQAVVKAGPVPALPQVFRSEVESPLKDAEAASWQSQLKWLGEESPAGSLQERSLDLSQASGLVAVTATFTHSSGRSGQVTKALFVDGEAPKLSLLEQALSANGEQRTLFWSASDNYQLRQERSALYACLSSEPSFLPRSFEELKNAPPHCALILKGEELHKASDQLNLGALTLEGSVYPASQLVHYLYAEDLVGHSLAIPMTPAPKNAAILTLASSLNGVKYTKESSLAAPLSLALVQGEQLTRIEAAAALWPSYGLSLERSPDKLASLSDFNASLNLPLGSDEGLYTFQLQAQEKASGLSSNTQAIQVVLDRTPPLVSEVQIQVPLGLLEATTQVSISWNASDRNGIAAQRLEYQSKGETGWTKLADLNGVERAYSVVWGTRPLRSFSVRVVAIDLAGNSGEGISLPWSPQIFNAAVLTSSVECFYCHLRVEGDVAGINFPANIHGDSGQRFSILGKLFASNKIPAVFKSKIADGQMSVSGGLVEDYDNSGLKIFPSQKDAAGVPIFPTLKVEQLKPRMNGTVTDSSGRRYSRIHEGNLVLTGTAAKPILLSGEFLVNGDLVIKGVYKGIGSIYAQNVYVVDDLISSDCLPGSTTCPFPFAGNSDAAKLESAKAAVKAKRSALYLAGIKQTVVGGVSTSWEGQVTLSNPYSWLPQNDYTSYCTQASYLRQADGSIFPSPNQHYDPTNPNDIRARCEVGRIDAFLYGHDAIAWRSYGNFLINGGFVGYKAALVSTVPYRWYHHVNKSLAIPNNPRNGMPANMNVIRYDWRLRAGGAGFESLKLLFDQ